MFDYVFHGPPTTGVNGSASALGIDASSGTVYYTDPNQVGWQISPPAVVAKLDLAAQNANIVATPLYAVPANAAGFYRVSAYIAVTTAAGTSSTMPQAAVSWTDKDTNVANGLLSFTLTSTQNNTQTNSMNTTVAQNAGTTIINVKGGTTISYGTQGYASTPANAMQYAVHYRLEYLGS